MLELLVGAVFDSGRVELHNFVSSRLRLPMS